MINSMAVVGRGALGILYASLAVDNLGPQAASFYMDEERAQRYATQQVTVNGKVYDFVNRSYAGAQPVDLVLIAVKSTGLAQVIDQIAPLVGPDTRIVSVMNGITSEQRLGERYGIQRVVTCVAQAMDVMREGTGVHYTKEGLLFIGATDQTDPAAVADVDDFFTRAHITHQVSDDITWVLWRKFMMNVGINQACAVFSSDYAASLAPTPTRRAMVAAMRETVAVAQAEGVNLTEEDLAYMCSLPKGFDQAGYPSMAQDRIACRPSEVDEFSGVIMRLAAKHGILVPTNEFLNAEVRAYEAAF